MKKTKRIVGVAALLLAALMLFSSCAVAYRKADPAEYVKFVDGFDYANFKLSTKIDRMIVKDSDIAAHVNTELFKKREAITTGDGINKPGAYTPYDTLTIRTILYDKDGNMVKTDFALGNKASTGDDGTVVLGSEQALHLGYGEGINSGLLAEIEDKLYLHPEDTYLAQNLLVAYNNIGGVAASGLETMPAFGYLTYSTTFNEKAGDKITTVAPVHFDEIAVELASLGENAKNDYYQAIYLGLQKLIEQQKDVKGKEVTPSLTKELNIEVYPVGWDVSKAVTDENHTFIEYNLDFSDAKDGKEYCQGTITVKLQGAINFTLDATAPSAFISSYTFPEGTSGTYTVTNADGTTANKDYAGTECTVYTYVIERAAYSRPDYNAETIKNVLGFKTEKTADDEVIKEYEESIRARLQKACDALAEEAVKEALLAQAMANTTLLKDPVRNIRNYVNEAINAAKETYVSGGYREQTNSAGGFVYDSFETYLTKTYYKDKKMDAEGNYITFESLEAVKEHLYAEGRTLVKENLLIYYLADLMGCRISDDQLLAMAQERGAAWAKEQIAANREYITTTYTEENLKKSYPDSYANTSDTKTQKDQLFESWGATSYADCLAKQLAYYSELAGQNFATWDEYAVAAYPDDAYDWEDYVEAKQGKENLYGIYHAEVVLERLFELNAKNIAEAYNEIAFDASLVELK